MEAPAAIPIGFRFLPWDEELLQHYLRAKIMNPNFQVPYIKEIDIYKFHPKELITDGSTIEGNYFFTQRKRKHKQGLRASRQTEGGLWKATNGEKVVKKAGISIGCKTTLVYHANTTQGRKTIKTNWIMHEYRLMDTPAAGNNGMNPYDWVICRIRERLLRKDVAKCKEKEVNNASEEEENAVISSGGIPDYMNTNYDTNLVPLPEALWFNPEDFILNTIEEKDNKGSSSSVVDIQDFNQVISDYMDSDHSADLVPLPEDLLFDPDDLGGGI